MELTTKDFFVSPSDAYPYEAMTAIFTGAILAFIVLFPARRPSIIALFPAAVAYPLQVIHTPLWISYLHIVLILIVVSTMTKYRSPVVRAAWVRQTIAILVVAGGLVLCWIRLGQGLNSIVSYSGVTGWLLGEGLGSIGSSQGSWGAIIAHEQGLLSLLALAVMICTTYVCGAVVLFLPSRLDDGFMRSLLAAGGLGILTGLLSEPITNPGFDTANAIAGTWALAFSVVSVVIACRPRPQGEQKRQVVPASNRRINRTVFGLPFVCVLCVLPPILALQRKAELRVQQVASLAPMVPLTDISQPMQDATVAMEDGNFYRHHGFDWVAIHRALRVDIRNGDIEQGGSTITQELAKNLFLSNDRTIWRKLQEIVYTIDLERTLSKKRILELYLNSIDYGLGQNGIAAAAKFYFHKTPSQLTLPESAVLVGTVPDPMHVSLDQVRLAEGEQTALGRMGYFFPQRYSENDIDDAESIPMDRLVYPFKDAWDRGATGEIPAIWHGVSFYSYVDPDNPRQIPYVAPCLLTRMAKFLDDARQHYHLIGIDDLGVYNDRTMRQSSTKLSAHAFGQAIDISGFRFADGSRVTVADHGNPEVRRRLAPLEALLRKYFDIVVDWENDPLRHQTHFHVEVTGPRSTAPRPPYPNDGSAGVQIRTVP